MDHEQNTFTDEDIERRFRRLANIRVETMPRAFLKDVCYSLLIKTGAYVLPLERGLHD